MGQSGAPDDGEPQAQGAAALWALWSELRSFGELGPQFLGVMALTPRLMSAARELAEALSRAERRDGGESEAAHLESLVDTLMTRLDVTLDALWAHEGSLLKLSESLGALVARASADPRLAASLERARERALDAADRAIEALVEAALEPERSHPADRALRAVELIVQSIIARLVDRAFPTR